jgi:hypothetical protein
MLLFLHIDAWQSCCWRHPLICLCSFCLFATSAVACNLAIGDISPFLLALLTLMLLLMLGSTGVPAFLAPLLLLMPLLFPMFMLSCVPTVPDFYLFLVLSSLLLSLHLQAFLLLRVALDVAEVCYVVSALHTVQSSPVKSVQSSLVLTRPVQSINN